MNRLFDGTTTDCPMDNQIKTHGTIDGFTGRKESATEKKFDTFRLFVWTILCQCQWDYLPYNFICDLYHGWYAKCRFLNQALSNTEIISRLTELAAACYSPWREGPYGFNPDFVLRAMSKPEPMIHAYGLKEWAYFQFGVNEDNFEEFTYSESNYGLQRITDPSFSEPFILHSGSKTTAPHYSPAPIPSFGPVPVAPPAPVPSFDSAPVAPPAPTPSFGREPAPSFGAVPGAPPPPFGPSPVMRPCGSYPVAPPAPTWQ